MHLPRKYKFWFLATNGLSVAGFWCTDVDSVDLLEKYTTAEAWEKTTPQKQSCKILDMFRHYRRTKQYFEFPPSIITKVEHRVKMAGGGSIII